MIIHQNLENGMLLRNPIHDRDDQLVESYGYEKLDLQSPYTDADFRSGETRVPLLSGKRLYR